jgi:hypothetical protein
MTSYEVVLFFPWKFENLANLQTVLLKFFLHLGFCCFMEPFGLGFGSRSCSWGDLKVVNSTLIKKIVT